MKYANLGYLNHNDKVKCQETQLSISVLAIPISRLGVMPTCTHHPQIYVSYAGSTTKPTKIARKKMMKMKEIKEMR